jgi:signal transduction histidine kinase
MKRLLLVVVALAHYGCSQNQEETYRLVASIDMPIPSTRLLVPHLTDDGELVGYDRLRRAIVTWGTGSMRVIEPCADSILDARSTSRGYVLAVQSGDSVRILRVHNGRVEQLGRVTGTAGHFVRTHGDSVLVWYHDGRFYAITPDTVRYLGSAIARDGAETIAQGTTLVVLDRLSPQLLLWEGIELTTQRKLYSSFIGGRIEQFDGTSSIVALLVRSTNGYSVEWYRLNERGDAVLTNVVSLPRMFYEPQALVCIGDTAVGLFASGIVVLTPDGIIAQQRRAEGESLGVVRSAYRSGSALVISGATTAMRIVLRENPWWWIERSIPVAARVAIGIAVLAVIGIIVRRFGRHRRLVGALLDRGVGGALLLVDRSMRLQRLNMRARALLGIKHGAPLGRPLGEYIHDGAWEPLLRIIEHSTRERLPIVEEITVGTSSEQRFIVSTEPLLTMFNHFEGMLVSLVDVTAQYQQWRLLNWSQLAHDMQTSLTTIRLSAEQLAGAVPPEREPQRARIQRLATVLLERMRDLVALGRSQQLQWEECALAELFEEAVMEISPIPAHISIDIRPTPLVVRLDRRCFSRALHNALTNAIRAIENRSGTITLWAQLEGQKITIGIRDTGRGMDAETLQRFQQPMFTTNRKGFGMGSMIMQRMIEQHGGRIEVCSAPGAGTTVLFHLPATLYVRHHR